MPLPFMGIFGFLGSKIGRYLALAGGLLLAVFAIRRSGEVAERRKQKARNLEEYVDVNKRARETHQDAARKVGSITDDELSDSLRKHGAQRD